MMALYDDRSFTIENLTLRVVGSAWTGRTISPREIVVAPLNSDKIRPKFSKIDGE